MKKSIELWGVLIVFLISFIFIDSVKAITEFSNESELINCINDSNEDQCKINIRTIEINITQDITIPKNKTIILNNSILNLKSGVFTNNGTIEGNLIYGEGGYFVSNGNMSATFEGSNITINDGEYKRIIIEGGNNIINDGTFHSTVTVSIDDDTSKLEIRGGNFIVGTGECIRIFNSSKKTTKLNIELSGGVYSTGDEYGAIAVAYENEDDKKSALDFIKDGYKLTPDTISYMPAVGRSYPYSKTEKKVSIEKIISSTSKKTTTSGKSTTSGVMSKTSTTSSIKNPSTNDNLLDIIVILGISAIGLGLTVRKKIKSN